MANEENYEMCRMCNGTGEIEEGVMCRHCGGLGELSESSDDDRDYSDDDYGGYDDYYDP